MPAVLAATGVNGDTQKDDPRDAVLCIGLHSREAGEEGEEAHSNQGQKNDRHQVEAASLSAKYTWS